ncbi:hypothetical protein JCM21714_4 [Gracilibacillus boraciitolerans JCM 21714]|uniref:Small acid soluble protein n=1 Tax=Gracilibacillus boraciitolerans JCM 21714 TaxID=1298598 RepID=W4VE91_9BACI|nr:small, acid-soluble spore protein, alpha/beta type [Gracilibacillus boraciitolerans]GAE91069.1 hypothetical protein JCM21714_4 [Gracilibacillus boraciitolerans JCM 21714]
MAKKNKILVPAEQHVSLNQRYNGNIKAKDAGKIGGHIGGKMVRELVKVGQQQLQQSHNDTN